jgi:hypothetical protein
MIKHKKINNNNNLGTNQSTSQGISRNKQVYYHQINITSILKSTNSF